MSGLPSALRGKFSQDVLWNLSSLVVAGVCLLGANYLVGKVYGAAALGVFNQVFAAYVVASQLAAIGIHSSVLAHVARGPAPGELRELVTTGLLLTLGSALVLCTCFVALARPLARLLDSPDVAVGILWATPGLACFALNKVILATLQGLRRMRLYALFQAGRMVLMATGLGLCGTVGVTPAKLPVVLSAVEGITLLSSLPVVAHLIRPVARAALRRWTRTHLDFGVRGFASGLFTELNNRIDVIILGAFVADASVGAYSLAQLAAEGVSQLLVALRINYAPVMVRLLADGQREEAVRVLRRGRNRVYLGGVAVGVLAVVGYALIMRLTVGDPVLARSWIYFGIMIAGWVASSGYVVFNNLLLWAHRPGWNTLMILVVVLSSVVADIVLVKLFGALGAACATALTCALSAPLLRVFVARVLGLRI